MNRSLWRIFRVPLGLGAASLIGLVGALLTDGPLDVVFALALAASLVAIVFALVRPKPER